ncbi:MAG: aminotransferase class IV [Phycisphaerales bacterium JB060]
MATVFLNGRLLRDDDPEASVSLSDAGFMHGVGLFETMTARHTPSGVRVVRVDEHVGRLVGSAKELGLAGSLRAGPLAEAVEHTAQSHLENRSGETARLRLTVTGGDLNLVRREAERVGAGAQTPTVAIVAQSATVYPQELYERGGMMVVADAKANPFEPTAGHKTLNYWWRLRELQNALAKGGTEALVFSITNHVCGGSVSNVFAVKDGELLTPIARGEEADVAGKSGAMPSAVLPGVTRAAVLEIAREQGLACQRRMLAIGDLLDADEVFCTNASFGVLAMTRIEGREIGDGAVGPISRRLREALLERDSQ